MLTNFQTVLAGCRACAKRDGAHRAFDYLPKKEASARHEKESSSATRRDAEPSDC
jgi:hypothetical protein